MRRIFLRTFVFFLTVLLFSVLYQSRASAAYTITTTSESTSQPSTQEAQDYLTGDLECTENCQAVVTENTRTVHITFTGLLNEAYTLCLHTSCINKSRAEELSPEIEAQTEERTASGGTLTLDVCADGEDSLKLLDEDEHECNDGDGDNGDYFWGRHVYGLALFNKDSPKLRVGVATFYVYQYYPEVKVSPERPRVGQTINVTIRGTRRPHSRANRNNYAVEIARQDDPGTIYSQDCINVPNNSAGRTIPLDGREEGDYIIKINEQTGDGELFGNDCSAEFTYYWIKIHVRNNHDRNPNLNKMEIIPDPNGTELAGLKGKKKAPPPPCATALNDSGNCPKVKTGIGIDIGTSPREFVKSIFSLILGISGGIALLLIIYSGYMLMVSRAKPEALQAAQDQLIAAVVGLVFIIFSLVVLQVIGVDILKIPGFNP